MDAIAAAKVIVEPGRVLSPGWVGWEGGRITEVEEGPPPGELDVHRGGPRSVLMPGLVNAHCHLPLGGMRHVADDLPFLEWLNQGVMPRLGEVADDRAFFEEGASSSARELLQGGVTTVADSFLRTEGVHAMGRWGLRGMYFQEIFGSMAEDDTDYIASLEELLEGLSEKVGQVPFGFSPHSPYTCPMAVFRYIAQRARHEGRRLSFHLAESDAEHDLFVNGQGPIADALRRAGKLDRFAIGVTPTAMLSEAGILGPDCIAAHCVKATADDVGLLADAGVGVVHCPTSNMKLAEGIAPVTEMLEAGVRVALGTDSRASVGALDMFAEMRTFLLAQRAIRGGVGGLTASVAVRLATVGGATVLGMEGEVGALARGMRADCVLLEANRPRHGDLHDPEAAVVWTCAPDDVALVTVDGQGRYRREKVG